MRQRNPYRPGQRLGMPIEAWPAEDQIAWHAAFEAKGPFGGRSKGSKLRQPTRDAIATCYARWLLWLQAHEPEAVALPIEDRTTEERVTDYLTDLSDEITPRVLPNYAARLTSALKLIAPKHDWSWLSPIIRRLERLAQSAQSPRWPFIPTDQLLAYGVELMKAAADTPALAADRRAEQFRDGLMIAFLAARPLRRKNMLELEIDTHLHEVGEGFKVSLPPEKMKNHTSLEFPLPAALVPFMRRYLTLYRPTLAAGPYGAAAGYPEQATSLWLARSGARFPSDSFADMITARILARFNLRLTPHDFRRCAATTIARNNPEEYLIIRMILGHATIAMAEKHYIQASGIEAAHRFQATMLDVRKTLTKSGQAAGRRF